jgi:hypothetical protein
LDITCHHCHAEEYPAPSPSASFSSLVPVHLASAKYDFREKLGTEKLEIGEIGKKLGTEIGKLGTDGTFPLSEKIIAATQSSHEAIEYVPSVPRFRSKQKAKIICLTLSNINENIGVADFFPRWSFEENEFNSS